MKFTFKKRLIKASSEDFIARSNASFIRVLSPGRIRSLNCTDANDVHTQKKEDFHLLCTAHKESLMKITPHTYLFVCIFPTQASCQCMPAAATVQSSTCTFYPSSLAFEWRVCCLRISLYVNAHVQRVCFFSCPS